MLIVIDGANVVGSRPDGWWRDRAGAARALAERLVAALAGLARRESHSGSGPGSGPGLGVEVVLVLEGAARAGVAAGAHPEVPLRVVHADGSGDDAVASVAAATGGSVADAVASGRGPVVAVTADRALADRVVAAGGVVTWPSRLWELLATQSPLA